LLPAKIITPGASKPLVGVHDPVYVKAIVVSDSKKKAAIVVYDMSNPPVPVEGPLDSITPVISLIAKELNIQEEDVFVSTTHVHCAPQVGNIVGIIDEKEKVFNDAFIKIVNKATIEAVRKAESSLRPAKVGVARGTSYINVNRNSHYYADNYSGDKVNFGINPAGFSDKTLFTVCFQDLDAKPIAFYVNYAVHPIVMIANQFSKDGVGISADIPGAVTGMLEKMFPGSLAIWAFGPSGDQNPIYTKNMYYPDPETGKEAEIEVVENSNNLLKAVSAQHFNDIMRTLKTIEDYKGNVQITTGVEWSKTPGRKVIKEDPHAVFSKIKEYITEGAPDAKIRVQLLRIGDIAIVGCAGDLYSSLGLLMREASPLKYTCVTAKCATYFPGYVHDDEGLKQNMFMAHASPVLPGYLSQSLPSAVKRLFKETSKN
jgi:hypothetical protein